MSLITSTRSAMRAPSNALLQALRQSAQECFSPVEMSHRMFPSSYRSTSHLKGRHRTRTLSLCVKEDNKRYFSSFHRKSFPEARTPNLAPKSKDRGPTSKEDTQTDFGSLNVLGNTPPPATAVDACLVDGFHLSNGVKIMGGSGCLLVGGEVFSWRPWDVISGKLSGANQRNAMVNTKRQWEVPEEAWGLLELVWPKPELLILGMGAGLLPLSPQTRQHINNIGIRVDVLDTRNASAQFNLLATERGVGSVAAALLPIGWKL